MVGTADTVLLSIYQHRFRLAFANPSGVNYPTLVIVSCQAYSPPVSRAKLQYLVAFWCVDIQ